MDANNEKKLHWTICLTCHGQGKVLRDPSRKKRNLYRSELDTYETSGGKASLPKPLTRKMDACFHCEGSGLQSSQNVVEPDRKSVV